ncbi:hypothetical protein TDB9533_03814 [Thalassocella blandensis]|nr:hypothetical protein TDB9533_03814 [Thalassocella blandensis]
MKAKSHLSRRHFLKRCAALSLGSSSALATLSRLQLAHAQTSASGDYRALVCVFLFGGNDSLNMLIPREQNHYDEYANSRQNLAIARESLLPISASSQAFSEFGLHPKLGGLQALYNQNKLAFVANTGSLIEPVTKASYQAKTVPLPPQLFSHNDQQKFIQSLQRSANGSGWIGRAADVMAELNANPRLSMNISLSGSNIWQSGASVIPYSVSPSGVETLTNLNRSSNQTRDVQRRAIFEKLLTQNHQHKLIQAYNSKQKLAWELSQEVSDELELAPAITTEFPENNRLAEALNMTAQVIAAREPLSMTRQTFFIGMGDFDTHGDQLYRQPLLMEELNNALVAFYQTLVELGLSDKVTLFTASDFGRTLTSNGDGTDHAWGSHQLVMGDAVKGGDIYGTMPSLAINSDDDIGEGRIIPTLSMDQYASTLGKWFGLDTSAYAEVFPNLVNFNESDIGFMV